MKGISRSARNPIYSEHNKLSLWFLVSYCQQDFLSVIVRNVIPTTFFFFFPQKSVPRLMLGKHSFRCNQSLFSHTQKNKRILVTKCQKCTRAGIRIRRFGSPLWRHAKNCMRKLMTSRAQREREKKGFGSACKKGRKERENSHAWNKRLADRAEKRVWQTSLDRICTKERERETCKKE